ncbi:hypothetical protein SBV1_730049 [Verrucomicrobia bacterium]|nr:hypothetical protein SBV1_730049 [Verrucomicrobiota bacterium]
MRITFRLEHANRCWSLGWGDASEPSHIALPPIAICISGQSERGLQKACADSPRSFPRLIRIASQVVATGALVNFSTAAISRWFCAAGPSGAPVVRAKLRNSLL